MKFNCTMVSVGLFILAVTGVNSETVTACERVDGALKIYEIG